MNALRHKAIRLRDALNVLIKATNDGGPGVWMSAGKALEKHWQVLGKAHFQDARRKARLGAQAQCPAAADPLLRRPNQ